MWSYNNVTITLLVYYPLTGGAQLFYKSVRSAYHDMRGPLAAILSLPLSLARPAHSPVSHQAAAAPPSHLPAAACSWGVCPRQGVRLARSEPANSEGAVWESR